MRAVAIHAALVDVAGEEVGAALVAAFADLPQQVLERDAGLFGPALAEVVAVGVDEGGAVLRDVLQVDIAKFRGLSGPVSMQAQYNLLARAVEWEIVPACQAAGLGMLAWSPLASGWLTGKYRRGEPPPAGTRVVENADEGMRIWNQRGQSEQTWQVLDAVRKVAEGRNVSLAQVAIAWLMARPAVSSVILGARSMDQLTGNMAAAELELTPEETQLLDEASEPPTPDYPYGEPGQSQRSRRIRGGRF